MAWLNEKVGDFDSRLALLEAKHVDMDVSFRGLDLAEMQQFKDRISKCEESACASPAIAAIEARLAKVETSPSPFSAASLDGASTQGASWADRLRVGSSPGPGLIPTLFDSPDGSGRAPSNP